MTQNKSRKWRLRSIVIGLLFLTGLLVFKLFEPVFIWNIGWKPMPDFSGAVGEQSGIPSNYAEIITRANQRLEQSAATQRFPGLSIAIGKEGEVVWARAMGWSDIESKTPTKLDTKFRAGSVAKAITGTLAAKMSEEGSLDLDASIAPIVPYYPKKIMTSQYDNC